MEKKAFQDYYPDDYSHCYGCGRLNQQGLQIKSYWDGNESVCICQLKPEYRANSGFVYSGLIASLLDCHAIGTAAAAKFRAENRDPAADPLLRFVTASLHVDYLKPAPMDAPLELRGRVREVKERKAIVTVTVSANGQECARGEVIGVLMPEGMKTQ
jgi:acyl-coenzyme A thioesterase PaaI-like protein